MREAVFETTGRITYPDEMVFCFNPNIIKVQTKNDVTFTVYSDSGGTGGVFDSTFDHTFTITKRPFLTDEREGASVVELDISSYLQALFNINRSGGMVESKVIHVKVATSVASMTFDVTAVWGAIRIGEVFDAPRKVVHFTKFPFTITYYDKAIKHVGAGDAPSHVTVETNGCETGVYLRWIDAHGFYQYWLFSEGTEESSTKDYGEKLLENFYGSTYGYYGMSRMQGKTTETSKKVCAPLVSQEVFAMLSSVVSSPLVDMYEDGRWVPIRVKAGKTTNSGAHLQDFEITILLPETITQTL